MWGTPRECEKILESRDKLALLPPAKGSQPTDPAVCDAGT